MNRILNDFLTVSSITFLFYAITYSGSLAIFNNVDIFIIPLFIVLVCFIEVFTIKIFFNIKFINVLIRNSKKIENLVLAVSLFINIYVVNLGFNDDFISLSFYKELSVATFFIVLFYIMFNILDESRRVRKFFAPSILVFSLVSITINFILFHESKYDVMNYSNEKMKTIDKNKLRSFPEYESNIKYEIKMTDKPNIVILTFDALTDYETYKKLTKRLNKPFIYRVIDDNLSSLKNHFSDEIGTRFSLASLLALTPDLLYTLPYSHEVSRDYSPRFRMFNGQTPSPLFEIFKNNGYEVSTFFVDRHTFGTFKGDYVDNFLTLPVRLFYRSSVCTLIGHRTKYIGFFGYCEILDKVKSILSGSDNITWETSDGQMEFNHYYFHIPQPYDLIRGLDKKTKPQLLFGHIVAPGHIGPLYTPNFRNKNDGSFRSYVLNYEKDGRMVGALIEKIVGFLKNENKMKDTIVYIMGDHGMMLSKRMTWQQDKFVDEKFFWDEYDNFIYGDDQAMWIELDKDTLLKTEQEYTILEDGVSESRILGPLMTDKNVVIRDAEPYRRLDRYSTYGGFISEHKCAYKSVTNNRERGYSTPQLVMHDLIACLSDYVITPNNREYIKDFKREKTLYSQTNPTCINSSSPCSEGCIEINNSCFAIGSDPVPYSEMLYE